MTCSFDGCTAGACKKGYCLKHYSHARRHGLLPVAPCSVEDCNSPAHGNGLCVAHHKRAAKHGDPTVCKKAANGTAHLVPCGFEGCGKPSISKGLCREHFAYSRRNGLFDKAPCSVDGCDRYAYHGKDMCNTHLQRFQRYGDANFRHKAGNGERKSLKCSVDGCERHRISELYCNVHYCRVKNHGDPHVRKRVGNGEATPESKAGQHKKRLSKYFKTPHGKLRRRFNNAKRRLLVLGLDAHISKEQFLALWAATECAICKCPIADADKTIDHITPLSRGGSNELSNLQIAHLSCNQLKGNRIDAANLPY